MNLAPLTFGRMLSAWTLDLPAVLVVVLLGAGYLAAVRGLGRAGRRWPRRHTVSFLAGLGTIMLMTMSFVGVYADTLFWTRAVQTVVLLMIAPLLLALGAPVSLAMASASDRMARRLRRLGRGAAARILTFPLVVTVLLVGSPFLLYFTPLYPLCLRNPVVDELVHGWLLGAGFVYFWTRLRVDPTPREDPYLVSLWISLTEVIFDGVLGLVIWLGPLIAADYYQALGRAWGPDLRLDQIIGAGVLWIGGDLAGLPFVGVLAVRWRKDDEHKAAQIDRELDEQEQTRRDQTEPGATVAGTGLWWENDPALTERFRRHR